jgi:hypothetical protein
MQVLRLHRGRCPHLYRQLCHVGPAPLELPLQAPRCGQPSANRTATPPGPSLKEGWPACQVQFQRSVKGNAALEQLGPSPANQPSPGAVLPTDCSTADRDLRRAPSPPRPPATPRSGVPNPAASKVRLPPPIGGLDVGHEGGGGGRPLVPAVTGGSIFFPSLTRWPGGRCARGSLTCGGSSSCFP